MQDIRFTISVAYHNQNSITQKCVENILQSEGGYNFEIILINNNSARKVMVKDPRIVYIDNKTNKGYKEAHEDALKIAKGKYFVILNNDIEVGLNWLAVIEQAFLSDPLVRVVGPVSGVLNDKGLGCETINPIYDYIEGSCLAIPTSFAKSEGLFHPLLTFAYCEDAMLSLYVRARGYKTKRVTFKFIHKHALTANNLHPNDRAKLNKAKAKNSEILNTEWGYYLRTKRFDETIAVKRDGANGDVLLSFPIIEQLKKNNPHRIINIYTACEDISKCCKEISNVYSNKKSIIADRIIDLNLVYERLPKLHIIDAYAKAAGVVLENRTPAVNIPKDAKELVSGKYALIHCQPTAWPGRNINPNILIDSILYLKKNGYDVYEIGTESFTKEVLLHTKINDLIRLMSEASFFLGIDSFPMHLAQTFNVPGVAAFGCINPKYRLFNNCITPVTANVTCKFCHHTLTPPITFSKCKLDNPICINRITSADVLSSVKERIK